MTEPFTGPGADPLKLYLRGERIAVAGIEADLRDASADAARRINKLETKHGIGSVVRRGQLAVIRRELRNVTDGLWQDVNKRIRSAGNAIADAAAKAEETLERILFHNVGKSMSEALVDSQRAYARRTVANYLARGLNGIGLSQRVYKTKSLANGYVDRAVNRVILQGGSWQDIAKNVKPMIEPNTPGGVSYAAKRLARTELNNAFHTTQKASAEVNPFVTGVRWHLSLSHTHEDVCDLLARGHSPGQPAGVYLAHELPPKAHPQCLCYTTNEVMDENEFLDLVSDPDYLDGLVDEYKSETAELRKVSGGGSVSVPKKTTPAPPAAKKVPPRTNREALKAAPLDMNSDKLNVNGLPGIDAERDEIQAYKGVKYSNINEYLRQGSGSFFRETVEKIDSAIGKSKLTSDVAVYRGIKNPERLFGDRMKDDLTGMEWLDEAYFSTSADKRVADDFAKGGGMVMRVTVRKGAPMLRLSEMGAKPDATHEAELLGGRGWKISVTGDRGAINGIRVIDVEVTSHGRNSQDPWER